jgi:hypothetical protein
MLTFRPLCDKDSAAHQESATSKKTPDKSTGLEGQATHSTRDEGTAREKQSGKMMIG